MRQKLLIFLIILVTPYLVTQIESQIMQCDYLEEHFSSMVSEVTKSSYGCALEISASNSEIQHQEIIGQHEPGKTDADVKAVFVSPDELLKHFSSIFCKKFQNLETLIFVPQLLESIDEDSLYECKNLDLFALHSSKISTLPENFFIHNPKLSNIAIGLGQMNEISENIFQNQKDVKIMSLRGNHKLSHLPPNIFKTFEKLTQLELRDSNLQLLNPKWFENLQLLEKLTIRKNPITEIPLQIFSPLVNLEELYLSENKIRVLNSDSFNGLEKLRKLYLTGNEIIELPRSVFVPLRNLEILNLDKNNLTEIHSDSFGEFKDSAELFFRSNDITSIDEKFIDKTAAIQINMDKFICDTLVVRWRTGIEYLKEKLSACFKNYRPRN